MLEGKNEALKLRGLPRFLKNIGLSSVKYVKNKEEQLKSLYEQLHANDIQLPDQLIPNDSIERLIIFNEIRKLISTDNPNVEFKVHIECANGLSSKINFQIGTYSVLVKNCTSLEKEIINIVKKEGYIDGNEQLSNKLEAHHIRNIQQNSAIIIQKAFRNFHITRNNNKNHYLIDSKAKKTILSHMILLNKNIKWSNTANRVNKTPKHELKLNNEEKLQFAKIIPKYNQAANGLQGLTEDELKTKLDISFKHGGYTCNDLAIHLAIKLREDTTLPDLLRQEIRICKVQAHVMCCIGDPIDIYNSIIVDPWIRYINLPVNPMYRPTESLHTSPDRERGFMGTVIQYKSFLEKHPNCYIPIPTRTGIEIHPIFNELSKKISSIESVKNFVLV